MSKISGSVHRWKIYLEGDFDFFTLDDWLRYLARLCHNPEHGNYRAEECDVLRSLKGSTITSCPLRCVLLISPMHFVPERGPRGDLP